MSILFAINYLHISLGRVHANGKAQKINTKPDTFKSHICIKKHSNLFPLFMQKFWISFLRERAFRSKKK